MPIHGRFDLQRVLVYEGEVTFIDAASDPAVAPDERLRARSLFVDLGRMLWSCSLAARTALDARLAAAAPPHDRPIGWTRRWVGWIGASFLEGYTAAADGERAAALAGDRETLEETLWRHWLLAALGDVTRCAAQSPAALVVVLEALLDALADADVIPS